MTVPTLVVSNPPHGPIDAKRAAAVLDLLPAEVGLKAHYPIPEIWVARETTADAEAAANELNDAGCHVAVSRGEELRDLPRQTVMQGASFTDGGLLAELEDGEVLWPYGLPLVAVICTPKFAGAGSRVGSVDGSGARGAFVDFYGAPDGTFRRLGVSEDATDLSALEGAALVGPHARFMRFIGQCEARFSRDHLDRRLTHLQLRQRQIGAPTRTDRHGFSFATRSLADLLGAISPELRNASQCELCSRLAYLTRRIGLVGGERVKALGTAPPLPRRSQQPPPQRPR